MCSLDALFVTIQPLIAIHLTLFYAIYLSGGYVEI